MKFFHKLLILSFFFNFSSASLPGFVALNDKIDVISRALDSSADIYTIEPAKFPSIKKPHVEFVGFFNEFDFVSVVFSDFTKLSFRTLHELQSIHYASVLARAPPSSLV